MIRFENVVKKFRARGNDKWILRGLNLTLPKGRNIGILGRNGAGKSTLIRMIAGADDPDYGMIHREVSVSWPLAFAGGVAGPMSGYDGCMFVCRLYGQAPERVIPYVQDFAELGHYFYEPIASYSSGMKSRLAFGMSMAMEFECYLIDEITAVGDARFKAKCLEAFRERRKRSSVIMVSHSMRTIKDYCDLGAILDDGQLKLYNDLEEAMAVYSKMMGGLEKPGSDD